MPISLPTEYNVPPQDISQYVIMLAGEKKIGKTSFAAQFPDHYIIECEPRNAIHLHCRHTDVGNWKEFVQVIDLLEKNKGYAKTVVIDDIPTLHGYCQDHICKQMGIDHPQDKAHGKAWGALDAEFQKQLLRLHNLGVGIIYTGHTKKIEDETRSGKRFTRIESYGGAGCIRWLDAKIHLWAVMLFDGEGNRELIISGDDYIKAANGLAETNFINQLDGKPLRFIPMGQSAKEGYNNFIKAFHNQLSVAPKQPKKTTAESLGLPAVQAAITKPVETQQPARPKFTMGKK